MSAQSMWPDIRLEQLFDPAYLEAQLRALQAWLISELLVASIVFQVAVIGLAYLMARFLAPRLRTWVEHQTRRRGLEERLKRGAKALAPLALPVCWLTIQWLSVLVAASAGWPHHLIKTVVSLLTAWVIIRLSSSLVRDPVWSKAVAITAWTIAALTILKLLQPTIALLDQLAISLGGLRISALLVIKGMLALAVLLGLATFASRPDQGRAEPDAVGPGPVQQAAQDRSGDHRRGGRAQQRRHRPHRVCGVQRRRRRRRRFRAAEGGRQSGQRRDPAARSIGQARRRDRCGHHLRVDRFARRALRVRGHARRHRASDPERRSDRESGRELVVQQQSRRLKASVGIAYHSDVRQAIRLCLDAAGATPRVLREPAPVCLVNAFGESSIDLELRFWIRDPAHGTSNVKSDVLLNVWDRFHEHGIEIPFPQRDLHIKTPNEFRVLNKDRPAKRQQSLELVASDHAPGKS